LFYIKLDPHCLRTEGAVLLRLPAHHSVPSLYSAEALPSGFSTKLPHCGVKPLFLVMFYCYKMKMNLSYNNYEKFARKQVICNRKCVSAVKPTNMQIGIT
jgi:hypothetical protein